MRLKRILRKALNSPLGYPIRRYYGGLGTCLVYHRITDQSYPQDQFYPERGLAVNTGNFAAQMEYISKYKKPLAMPEFEKNLQNGSLRKDSIVVTFDDGYRDNLTEALPILEKYDVPATIFVTSGFISREEYPWWHALGSTISKSESVRFKFSGNNYDFPCHTVEQKFATFYELDRIFKSLNSSQKSELCSLIFDTECIRKAREPFLSWEEVVQLDRHPLITIGAHTHTHSVFRTLTNEELVQELKISQTFLESKLGHPVLYFAYPYGGKSECTNRSFSVVQKTGYSLAFTTRSGHIHRSHKAFTFALPRIVVDHYHTIEDFRELLLSGLASMIKRRGERFVID